MQHLANATAADAAEDFSFAELDMLVPYPDVVATPTGSVVDDLNSLTIHNLNQKYTEDNVARLEMLRKSANAKTFLRQLPAVVAAVSGYRAVLPANDVYNPYVVLHTEVRPNAELALPFFFIKG